MLQEDYSTNCNLPSDELRASILTSKYGLETPGKMAVKPNFNEYGNSVALCTLQSNIWPRFEFLAPDHCEFHSAERALSIIIHPSVIF